MKKCGVCKTILEKRYKDSYQQFNDRRFCSRKCGNIGRIKHYNGGSKNPMYKNIGVKTLCKECGIEFTGYKDGGENDRKYCSRECMLKNKDYRNLKSMATKGKKKSEEHKKKLSISKIGTKRSIESRKRQSEALSGSKSHFWKGGITKKNILIRASAEYKQWSKSILTRDNWTCARCLVRSGTMNAHHIKNFSQNKDLIFDIDNGITLCEKCHRYFHGRYGLQNNNKEQLIEFIKLGKRGLEIDNIMSALKKGWAKHSSERFGQYLFNHTRFGTRATVGMGINDIFHYSDEDINQDLLNNL